jgi:hypothetical protein
MVRTNWRNVGLDKISYSATTTLPIQVGYNGIIFSFFVLILAMKSGNLIPK